MLANKFIDKMDTQKTMYTAITVAIVLCSVIALYSSNFVLAAIPVGILGVFATIKDYRILYYGFWAVLPFSVEVYLGSFGTDLPTEPIMLGLTGIAILVFITKMSSVSLRHLQHPISILIILHLGWMFFTCLFSRSPVISYKFFLAKLWYVIPFFFLSFHMIKDVANVHLIFKILSVFLTAAISIVLIRHAIDGFTFMGSHHVVRPIFRNHVNYSAIVVAVLPFMWALYKNTESGYYKKALILVLILFVFGTYFSYTRAAQLCVFISIGAFFIFKYKLGKLAITGSCIVAVLLTTNISILHLNLRQR
jgi:O-antigen ligase